MTEKIFRSMMTAMVSVLLASLLLILGCLYEYFGNVQEQQLAQELSLAAAGVESAGMDFFPQSDKGSSRLTWIAPDGSVLYDGQADRSTMENHGDREEVREALFSGEGTSSRYSSTLLEKTIYCARRLSDGSVLRISVSHASMAVLVVGMLPPICAVLLAALVLAFLLASRLSRRIMEPLNTLDLDHPLDNQTYDELAPLLKRISRQRSQIDAQLAQLRQRQEEFSQITASMNEGLVLLNREGSILSMNPAAARLFHPEGDVEGQDFLTVERSPEISNALHRALQTGHDELSLQRNGRIYQLDVSRILWEGKTAGLVLLLFDVTERANGERARREFTANVSHELKTPLTAILGSSELIENGMVRPEDLPRFAGHIHGEAARLLSLIEDILRLSQLDEGAELPREAVSLDDAARAVAAELQEQATQGQVSLTLSLRPCTVWGEPRLVHEIVRNLAENAIKYNVAGGSVTITVTEDGTLTVADTGIGIPPAQQSRVFERFYRVDKSHSRAIGGTGLGLSIVKHACADLGAKLRLESAEGQGTTVQVFFPRESGQEHAPSSI